MSRQEWINRLNTERAARPGFANLNDLNRGNLTQTQFTSGIPDLTLPEGFNPTVSKNAPYLHDVTFPEGTQARGFNKELADLVLGANQDIKYNRALLNPLRAQEFADKHKGWTLDATHDVNADGANDVIIYNQYGEPVVINGYSIAPTSYPYKTAYYAANPNQMSQIMNPYGEFVREFARTEQEQIGEWAKKGIRNKKPPKAATQVVIIKRQIMGILEDYIDRKVQVDVARISKFRTVIKGLIPKAQIASIAYQQIVAVKLKDQYPQLAAQAHTIQQLLSALRGREGEGKEAIENWLGANATAIVADAAPVVMTIVDSLLTAQVIRQLVADAAYIYEGRKFSAKAEDKKRGKLYHAIWREWMKRKCNEIKNILAQNYGFAVRALPPAGEIPQIPEAYQTQLTDEATARVGAARPNAAYLAGLNRAVDVCLQRYREALEEGAPAERLNYLTAQLTNLIATHRNAARRAGIDEDPYGNWELQPDQVAAALIHDVEDEVEAAEAAAGEE